MNVPHYLQRNRAETSDTLSNFGLRSGQVLDIIYPEDSRSQSKRLVEYNVLVQHRDPVTDTATGRQYRCTRLNELCGLSERQRLRLRKGAPDANGRSKGSHVLVLCVNGETAAAIIVGGLRDDRDTDKGWRDEDVVWDWQVNGVEASVGGDGDLHVRRGGPVDDSGEHSDGGEVAIDTDAGKLLVKPSDGLRLGEATDNFPLFTTYRKDQARLHQTMTAQLQVIGKMLATIASSLLVPVAGPVAASPQFTNISNAFEAINQAIQAFELQDGQFESRLHKND